MNMCLVMAYANVVAAIFGLWAKNYKTAVLNGFVAGEFALDIEFH